MHQVSVIIPTYNLCRYVLHAVTSALTQSGVRLQVVVVDDGSTDDTARALESVRPHIRYVQQENRGVTAARNNGAAVSTGEWLCFLDADDELKPGAIRALLDAGEQSAAEVVYGKIEQDEDLEIRTPAIFRGDPPEPAIANFWRSRISAPGSALVRARLHRNIGGFMGSPPTEDRYYWLRCGTIASFAFCDKVVMKKTNRAQSASANRDRAVVSGVELQLEYLNWCCSRHIDVDFLDLGPYDIYAGAAAKARKWRAWRGLYGTVMVARKRREVSPGLIAAMARSLVSGRIDR